MKVAADTKVGSRFQRPYGTERQQSPPRSRHSAAKLSILESILELVLTKESVLHQESECTKQRSLEIVSRAHGVVRERSCRESTNLNVAPKAMVVPTRAWT